MQRTSAAPPEGSGSRPLLPVDDEETLAIVDAVLRARSGAAPAPERRIGRFVNVELHARGGMGRVFVAYDPKLDRKVALKALPVGLSNHDPEATVSRREGKALAVVNHRHVVQVYEVVEHLGADCLVLEHVDGVNLGDWLQAAPRSAAEVLAKFLQAGEGLAAVHAAGLVHRDFKPANAVVGPGGVVKLIDFGLADREAAPGAGEPRELAWIGTPKYMSPEQIRSVNVGPRSDQFSFCVALYEALMGVHPYISPAHATSVPEAASDTIASQLDADSRRVVFADMTKGPLRTPAEAPTGVAKHVRAALLRGLGREADGRFATMAHLLAELARDPKKERQRALFGGACVLGLALSLGVAHWLGRPEVCATGEETAAQLWKGRRAAAAERLKAFGGRSLAALDRRAEELAAARVQRCELRVRGDVEEHALARSACLQAREAEFDAAVATVVGGDERATAELSGRLEQMAPVSGCDDVARLAFYCESTASPEELARGTVALLSGDFVTAKSSAEAALAAGRSLAAPGLEARAQVLLGRILHEQGEWTQAQATLTRAAELATHNVCCEVSRESFHWLTKVVAFDERIPRARGDGYSELHEWLVPAGDVAGRADVLNNRALLLLRRGGDAEAAAKLLREAIALRAGQFDGSMAQADSYLNLASALNETGHKNEAMAALDEAETRRRAALGESRTLLHKELRNRGNRAFEQGAPREALALYKDAVLLATRGLGAEAPVVGDLYIAQARALDRLGDREAALAAAQTADSIYSKLPADDLRRSETQEAVAQTLNALGRFAEALPWLERSEQQLKAMTAVVKADRRADLEVCWAEALNGAERPVEGEARARSALGLFAQARTRDSRPTRATLLLAEALMAQRRWQEAIAAFEQAVAEYKSTNDNPELLGWAFWGLAKCLCNEPRQRPRAKEQAENAISQLEVIDPKTAGHIRTWMATALSDQPKGPESCLSSI